MHLHEDSDRGRTTPPATPTGQREVYRAHGELFDAETGHRLCLHELITDLRDGRRFRATDASTGKDLTIDTLLQAVSLSAGRLGSWLDQIQRSLLGADPQGSSTPYRSTPHTFSSPPHCDVDRHRTPQTAPPCCLQSDTRSPSDGHRPGQWT
ncbi:hypothetical protein [Streptomyces sp. NPDC023327]|uniref:hypothetical protein n=1 Tax=Streptomyces sp. NPDC023327 TaxID=3157088 RepID=UPI0033F69FBA